MFDKRYIENQTEDEQDMEEIRYWSTMKMDSSERFEDPVAMNCETYGIYYDEELELYVLYRENPIGQDEYGDIMMELYTEYFSDMSVEISEFTNHIRDPEGGMFLVGAEWQFGEENSKEWFEKAARDSIESDDESDYGYIHIPYMEPRAPLPYSGGKLKAKLRNPPISAVANLNPEPLTDEEKKEVYKKIEGDSNE